MNSFVFSTRAAHSLAADEDVRAAHRAAVASSCGSSEGDPPADRASALVFPQIRKPEQPMCEGCLTVALRIMGYDGAEMTWHGFRALASTQLHELGWHDLWIETQLAHGDRKKVRASYNHAKYLPQRRTMMQAWADYLDSLRAGTEIAVSSEVGQRAALTASDAFQYVDVDRALGFSGTGNGGAAGDPNDVSSALKGARRSASKSASCHRSRVEQP